MAKLSYTVRIHTGDKKGSGTNANVWMRLQDSDETRTPWTRLDTEFRDDFQPAGVDEYVINIDQEIKDVWRIQLWRDEAGWSPDWYIDLVMVTYNEREYPFPVLRWIPAKISFYLEVYDCSLPQNSSTKVQRNEELVKMRHVYKYESKFTGLPPQIRELPLDEQFSVEFITNLEARKSALRSELFGGTFRSWGFSSSGFNEKFTDLQEYKDVFEQYKSLETPKCIESWMDDEMFGALRLAGVNCKVITLCTEIPENFGIDAESVERALEGRKLKEAMDAKKLFICDLKILEGIYAKPGCKMTKPISLYYLNEEDKLVPVAIQLFQNKSADNPVFYPCDEPYLWLLAKMWCNNADATYHQVIAHLGNTHLIMEPFYISMKRHISSSHPIFKLLAPHLQYILPVNWTGRLFEEKGPLFKFMTVDLYNMSALLGKRFRDFDISQDGDFVQDIKNRQVFDADVLPNYPYRDDGLLLYNAITKYVKAFVKHYYKSEDDIKKDYELMRWGWELVCPVTQKGCGIKGLPTNGAFQTYDELISVLRYIVFTCSAEHSAVNMNVYEIYGFPAFYPAQLRGLPPHNKEPRRVEDILAILPNRSAFLETALTSKLLSQRTWPKLGDFEVPYVFDPEVINTVIADFRKDLEQISLEIVQRNSERTELEYHVFDPAMISNNMPN